MFLINMALSGLAGAGIGVSVSLGYYVIAVAFAVIMVNLWMMPIFWRGYFRHGFTHGWLAGRHAMIQSICEAQRRHMSLPDWITAEMERDGFDAVSFEIEDD
jgi:hypothetical protein